MTKDSTHYKLVLYIFLNWSRKNLSMRIVKNMVWGFTLAEVLITLGIIGVIAAITIPLLMNSNNDKEIVVATKKVDSVFSQALKLAEAANGTIDTWGFTNHSELFNDFTPYLKLSQNCGTAIGQGCFPKGFAYKNIGGTATLATWDDNGVPKGRLNDGMSFAMFYQSKTCGTSVTGNPNNSALNNICGTMIVDVNGDKLPNVTGKDTFHFYITKYGIIPSGSIDDTTYPLSTECSNKSGTGYGCTAWIIYKENMDYIDGAVSW